MILQDDSSPRNEWKLARVVEAHPNADGKVRKLKLLVNSTTIEKGKTLTRSFHLERPIHKVVTLLEANSSVINIRSHTLRLEHFYFFQDLCLKEIPHSKGN